MTESKYKFEKLTPVDDVELSVYEDAINFVFENPDVKNVAISGAYSAGKSSVLASYKKKHGNIRFLPISLAHFKASEQESEEDIKESVLEGKILNQLIHQIPAENIPQTNFRVKKKINPKSVFARTALTCLLLISILHIIFFSRWEAYIRLLPAGPVKMTLDLSVNPYSRLVSGSALTLVSCVFIYGLIKTQKNRNIFRKLNLQGNEIEIFEETDDSYFDKYLNEVLYLFENAEADVIVFEDMDRFNVNRIFERLREVNTLVNIQLKKEGRKPLRFFYLLRDDIFVSKDRTKFFDCIIPVVPVVDGTNSYDKLIELFKQSSLVEKFEASFLHGLSLYIDDMRLLKNIYNEFLIYYNRLNTIELDYNKMLAIVAYKNLFPRDFSDLQLNRGFVAALFAGKDKLARDEVERLRQQIAEKKNKIQASDKENNLTLQELNLVFEAKKTSDYWGRKQPLTQEQMEEYKRRKEAVENRSGGLLASLENEVQELEKELVIIQSRPLRELLTRENINTAFAIKSVNEAGGGNDYGEIKSSEYFSLLKYLIWNGYIDETYADYMTYFYENSLSRNDKTFLRSITDKKAKEYTYQLKNPQLVVSRLRPVDFDQEEILNFDLLRYLLQTPSLENCLCRLIGQLRRNRNMDFVREFLDQGVDIPAFVKHLNQQWPELFQTALETGGLTARQIWQYAVDTLYYSEDSAITNVNKENCLCRYISDSAYFLKIKNPVAEKLIHGFQLLGVHFVNINYDHSDRQLFTLVYEKSLYEINRDTIRLFLRVIFQVGDEEVRHKNYSLIMTKPDSPLAAYIHENMETYVGVMLEFCGGVIMDDEKDVLDILNNGTVPDALKHDYINRLKTPVKSLTFVEDTALWGNLLRAGMAACTEENIMEYFCITKALDECLVSSINSCRDKLDFSRVAPEYGNEKMKNLFDAMVVCGTVRNRKYRECVLSLSCRFEDFNVSGIPDDKIWILITEGIVMMNDKTLAFFRNHYRTQLFPFIRKNMEEYIALMRHSGVSLDELVEILSWNISDELKISLLELTGKEISIVGKNYSTKIKLYILNHNFKKSDQNYLFAHYTKYEEEIRDTIFGLALAGVEEITRNPEAVSPGLKRRLLRSEELDKDKKMKLFITMMPSLKEIEIKQILSILKLNDYIKIFDPRSRPRFPEDSVNKILLAAFKENGWIVDYMSDPARKGYYKIIRKKG